MNIIKPALLTVSLLILQACTFTQHEVAFYPSMQPIESTIGEGTNIGFRVYDDRDSQTVGQRGAGMVGADINASSIMLHLDSELRRGFTAQGFKIVSSEDPSADAKLTISLRSLKFFIETGFWTGANNVSVAIKADGNRDGDEFRNSYNFDSEERALVVPDGSGIDQALNAGLTDVLTQLFADSELMKFLANPSS
jgi:uncharacterized lipoprotein YajG